MSAWCPTGLGNAIDNRPTETSTNVRRHPPLPHAELKTNRMPNTTPPTRKNLGHNTHAPACVHIHAPHTSQMFCILTSWCLNQSNLNDRPIAKIIRACVRANCALVYLRMRLENYTLLNNKNILVPTLDCTSKDNNRCGNTRYIPPCAT